MRFSVIVPVYNTEDYLEACLASLCSQTFRDFEVVMVDDGSTDGSYAILERYHKQEPGRFHLICQENCGLGGARNTGMKHSKGEYLFFLDSDDYVHSETLSIVDEYLRRSGDDLLIFGFRKVEQENDACNEIDRRLIVYEKLTPEQYIRSFGGPQSFLIRREVFQKNDLTWPERLWYEDHALLPMFALYARGIGRINVRLYQYRLRDTSIMHSRDTGRMMEIIDGCEFFLKRYEAAGKLDEFYPDLEYRVIVSVLFAHIPRLFTVGREMDKAQASWQYVKKRFPTFRTNPYVVRRSRQYRPEALMLEGQLEELWDEYYTPPLEKAERYLSAAVPDASRWDSPQLSVVIPVYNVQEYLLPCLRSVLAATEGIERELILVNDGSTDESGEIARRFAAHYACIRLIEQENRGLSAARNRGMDLARGEYLSFVDSDDEVLPTMYRDMLRAAAEYDTDMVVCPAWYGTDPAESWGMPQLHRYAFEKIKPGIASREDRLTLLACDSYAWNKLYRRDFLLSSGIRYPEGKLFEDNGPSAALYSKAGRIYALQKAGCFYRYRKGGVPSIVQGQKDLRNAQWLEMMRFSLRLLESASADNAAVCAAKDRYISNDIANMLKIQSLNFLDHPGKFLRLLRDYVKADFSPEDISGQNALVRARIRALMNDDLEELTALDEYERSAYRKSPVSHGDGALIRALDKERLGVEEERAPNGSFSPQPGAWADRYEKKPGAVRLDAHLTLTGMPKKTELGAKIHAFLVEECTGQSQPLTVEPEGGTAFHVTLEENALWQMTEAGKSCLLYVTADCPCLSVRTYMTGPVSERLFCLDGEELWLQKLPGGRLRLERRPSAPEPLISVIVPVYNASATLDRCMRSLLAQTHHNLEILLVDDGSTDGSTERCGEYAALDPRVRSFRLEHGGVARARNHALERYTGEFLMFADADDLVSPDIVERLLGVIRESGMQVAACVAKDTRDTQITEHTCSSRGGFSTWHWSRINYLATASHRVIWGALYARTAVEGLRFDERYSASTDTLFFAQVARRVRRYAQINETHYCYVLYPNSICHGGPDGRKLDDLRVWEQVQAMNPAGSKGYMSAGKMLVRKTRMLLNALRDQPDGDPALFRETCRLIRRHRADELPGEKPRQRFARKLFALLPGEYTYAVGIRKKVKNMLGK